MDGKFKVPSKIAEAENSDYSKKFKKLLRLPPSTANAALYADTKDFGLGYPNRLDCEQLAAATHTFALANANTSWARGFFNLLLNWTRQQCGILRVSASGTTSFFDWDISNLSWNAVVKLKNGNEITSLLATCLQQELQVKPLCEDRWGPRWTLCPGPASLMSDKQPEWEPKKIKNISQGYTSAEWARQLQMCKSHGKVARLQLADKELSNAWRKKGVLPESSWRWAIRAQLDVLATSVNMCFVYKLWNSAICPLCKKEVASLSHVLCACEAISSNAYTYRHNLVVDLLEECCIKHGWKVVTKGVELPESLIRPSLRRDLQHTRPDMVLVNDFTAHRIEVILVEVAVAFESDRNLARVNARKKETYTELMRAIALTRQEKQVIVRVVPVIIGARGIVPVFWAENLKPLSLSGRAVKRLAKSASVQAIKGSQWIWGLWTARAHGGIQNEQGGYK